MPKSDLSSDLGGTERTFARRQKAIEADENRRSVMAIQDILEIQSRDDDNDDDLKDQSGFNSKRKKIKLVGEITTAVRKRGRTSGQAESGVEIGTGVSLDSKGVTISTDDTQVQQENSRSSSSKRTKGIRSVEVPAAVSQKRSSVKHTEPLIEIADSDEDEEINSVSETEEFAPRTESIRNPSIGGKGASLVDVSSLLVIDKILAIRMKSSFTGIAQNVLAQNVLNAADRSSTLANAAADKSIVTTSIAFNTTSITPVDGKQSTGNSSTARGLPVHTRLDPSTDLKAEEKTEVEIAVGMTAGDLKSCGIMMDTISWPSDSEQESEGAGAEASPTSPSSPTASACVHVSGVVIAAAETDTTTHKSVPCTNTLDVSDSMHTSTIIAGKKVVGTDRDTEGAASEEKKNGSESTREFLVKYIGKSYRALAWVDEHVIKSSESGENKLKGFLRVFKRKGSNPLPAITADSEPFSLESIVDFDWLEIERVVAIYTEVIGAPGSLSKDPKEDPGNPNNSSNRIICNRNKNSGNRSSSGKISGDQTAEIALVKWRGLGYAECTWESWSEVQNEEALINECRTKDLEVEAAVAASTGLAINDTDEKSGKETVSRGKKNSNLNTEGELEIIKRVNMLTGRALSREDIPVRNVSLRDYQIQGINWLLFQWTQGRSCLLADEMGLGKTMQAVGLIETLRVRCQRPGPFLVVVPLSTIRHWQKEFDERSQANTVVLHGTNEDRDSFVGGEFTSLGNRRWVAHFDVMITTYETVQQELAFLKQLKFTAMVVDEAHRLKNSATQVRASLKDLDVDFTVLLTGTPIQNNIPELHSLLNFMHKEEFEDREDFLNRYGAISTDTQVTELQEILCKYMLRREKRDVELTLPKKTETVIEVELTLTQKRWYRAVFERNRNFLMQGPSKKIPSLINVLMQLRKVCNHPFLVAGSREAVYEDHYAAEAAAAATSTAAAATTAITGSGGDRSLITSGSANSITASTTSGSSSSKANSSGSDNVIASALPSLSDSNHITTAFQAMLPALPPLRPLQALQSNNVVTDSIITYQIKSERSEEAPKATVLEEVKKVDFPQSENTKTGVGTLREAESDNKNQNRLLPSVDCSEQTPDPALKDPLVYCSGKIVFLHKLLIKLKRENSKSLIFSQFTTTLDVIQEYLTDYGYAYERIDGGVTGYNRSAAITRFNQADSVASVFLLTTRAGGLGLNLQAANTVIIYDSDWNPQGDLQAIARCHRLGQQKEVKVYRLLTRQTAETTMFRVASKKLGLTNILLNGLHSKVSKKEERNIDEVLREGATDLFSVDDEASKKISDKFMAEDIDNILKERSKEVVFTDNGYEDAENLFSSTVEDDTVGGTDKQKSLFSQATFISNKSDSLLRLDDADFWAKALPKEHTRIGRIKTLFTCPESLKLLKGQQKDQETAVGVKATKKAKADAWKRLMPVVTEINDLRSSGEKPFETEEVLDLLHSVLISDVYPEEMDRLQALSESIERPKRRRNVTTGHVRDTDLQGKGGKRGMKSREKEKDSDNDSDAEVDDDDADDDDDDDDDDVEEKNKKKRKRRKGRGNEEDAWLPDELTDGPLGKETKLQIQQRAQLGSGQYKMSLTGRMVTALRLNTLKKFYPEVETKNVRSFQELMLHQQDPHMYITGNSSDGAYGGAGTIGAPFNPPTRGGRGQGRGRDGSQRGRGATRPGVYNCQPGMMPSGGVDYSNMSLEQQKQLVLIARQREELQRRQQMFQMRSSGGERGPGSGSGVARLPPIPGSGPSNSNGPGLVQGQQFSVDPFRLYSKVVLCSYKDRMPLQSQEDLLEMARRSWHMTTNEQRARWTAYAEKVGEKVSDLVLTGMSANVQIFLDEVIKRASGMAADMDPALQASFSSSGIENSASATATAIPGSLPTSNPNTGTSIITSSSSSAPTAQSLPSQSALYTPSSIPPLAPSQILTRGPNQDGFHNPTDTSHMMNSHLYRLSSVDDRNAYSASYNDVTDAHSQSDKYSSLQIAQMKMHFEKQNLQLEERQLRQKMQLLQQQRKMQEEAYYERRRKEQMNLMAQYGAKRVLSPGLIDLSLAGNSSDEDADNGSFRTVQTASNDIIRSNNNNSGNNNNISYSGTVLINSQDIGGAERGNYSTQEGKNVKEEVVSSGIQPPQRPTFTCLLSGSGSLLPNSMQLDPTVQGDYSAAVEAVYLNPNNIRVNGNRAAISSDTSIEKVYENCASGSSNGTSSMSSNVPITRRDGNYNQNIIRSDDKHAPSSSSSSSISLARMPLAGMTSERREQQSSLQSSQPHQLCLSAPLCARSTDVRAQEQGHRHGQERGQRHMLGLVGAAEEALPMPLVKSFTPIGSMKKVLYTDLKVSVPPSFPPINMFSSVNGYLIWRSTIIPHPGLSGSHLTHFSGELLLGIDGKAAKDLSVATVLDYFSRATRNVIVVVRRIFSDEDALRVWLHSLKTLTANSAPFSPSPSSSFSSSSATTGASHYST